MAAKLNHTLMGTRYNKDGAKVIVEPTEARDRYSVKLYQDNRLTHEWTVITAFSVGQRVKHAVELAQEKKGS